MFLFADELNVEGIQMGNSLRKQKSCIIFKLRLKCFALVFYKSL